MKQLLSIAAVLIILLTAAALIRLLSGGEDSWTCKNGEWVRHGMPFAPPPTAICE